MTQSLKITRSEEVPQTVRCEICKLTTTVNRVMPYQGQFYHVECWGELYFDADLHYTGERRVSFADSAQWHALYNKAYNYRAKRKGLQIYNRIMNCECVQEEYRYLGYAARKAYQTEQGEINFMVEVQDALIDVLGKAHGYEGRRRRLERRANARKGGLRNQLDHFMQRAFWQRER